MSGLIARRRQLHRRHVLVPHRAYTVLCEKAGKAYIAQNIPQHLHAKFNANVSVKVREPDGTEVVYKTLNFLPLQRILDLYPECLFSVRMSVALKDATPKMLAYFQRNGQRPRRWSRLIGVDTPLHIQTEDEKKLALEGRFPLIAIDVMRKHVYASDEDDIGVFGHHPNSIGIDLLVAPCAAPRRVVRAILRHLQVSGRASSVPQCFPAEQLLGVRERKALIDLLDSEHRRAQCWGPHCFVWSERMYMPELVFVASVPQPTFSKVSAT